jgi:transposase
MLNIERTKELKAFVEAKKGTAVELARAQAILMHEREMGFTLIQELTGFKRSALFKWKARFSKQGCVGIKEPAKRKPRALLTKTQCNEIIKNIKTTTPESFGYETKFWTTGILAHLIKEQYNVVYKTKRPFYLLFKGAKFTYHKPGQQYKNRSQTVVDEWKEKNIPIIKQHLQGKNAVVLTGDEMVLSTQTTVQKIWLPKNEFPKIDISNKRMNRSVYGFLNVLDGSQHAFKTEWQNSAITCEILEGLCQIYNGKDILLVWDNAPWHRSKEVRKWLSETKHKIRLLAFPPYAPDLNPQEHVWKAGRSNVTHNTFIENIDKAADQFVSYLNDTCFPYDFFGVAA